MDLTRFLLIACLTVIIGVGIPAGIYFMFRRENRAEFIQIIQKSSQEIRNPFRKDQEDMDELARRVAELKNREEGTQISADIDQSGDLKKTED
jgi:hypothetical protein